ncbi:hypothetical protein, partial [Nonomuraea cypriaca]|uniref:hypothetical protein n=1 Tax=Nonomuraea cypriaca TaxID=1187855 RepID=UPI001A9C71C4
HPADLQERHRLETRLPGVPRRISPAHPPNSALYPNRIMSNAGQKRCASRLELREVVDRLCGPGTADPVLIERRRQAEEAHRMVQRLWDERYRDDPTGAARAETRVRGTRERITAQTEQIAQARAARLTSRSDCADMS